jgi:hypothetical protein
MNTTALWVIAAVLSAFLLLALVCTGVLTLSWVVAAEREKAHKQYLRDHPWMLDEPDR